MREAPTIEQFAREHPEFRVIGAGAGDTLQEAVDFTDNADAFSFPMYWDESFQSWGVFGVQGTPATLLVGLDGQPLKSWNGATFDPQEAVDLIADQTNS